MLGSDRSGYLAAVGAGLLAVFILAGVLAFSYHLGDLAASKRTQGYRYAAEYPSDTDKRIADCPTNASVSSLKQCIEEAIAASRDAQRSEKDLSAQRQMADWAFWVLVASCISTVVTALGTVFLAIQIDLTRKALKGTNNATDAMREANKIAKSHQRPWVTVAVKLISGIFYKEPGGKAWLKTIVVVKNVGNTPAFNLRVNTRLQAWADESFFKSHKMSRGTPVANLAPQAEYIWGQEDIAFDGRTEDRSPLNVCVSALYNDVDGELLQTGEIFMVYSRDANASILIGQPIPIERIAVLRGFKNIMT